MGIEGEIIFWVRIVVFVKCFKMIIRYGIVFMIDKQVYFFFLIFICKISFIFMWSELTGSWEFFQLEKLVGLDFFFYQIKFIVSGRGSLFFIQVFVREIF